MEPLSFVSESVSFMPTMPVEPESPSPEDVILVPEVSAVLASATVRSLMPSVTPVAAFASVPVVPDATVGVLVEVEEDAELELELLPSLEEESVFV